MTGIDELLVTVYSDIVAIVLSFGLFVLTGADRKRKEPPIRYFRLLVLWIILFCLVNSATYISEHHAFGENGRFVAMITETGLEVMLTLIVWTWLMYVDYSLYHSLDHLRMRAKYWMIPIYIIFVLLIINLFTGSAFYYDENVVYHPMALYYVQIAFKYLYVLASFVLISIYKRNNGTLHYVNVWNFAIPTLVGAVLTNLTPYSFMGLSMAVACVMIYFSVMNEKCYIDGHTGFYNRAYLDNLFDLNKKGRFSFNSGIVFELEGGSEVDDLVEILKEELPEECETVRIGKKKFLSLTQADRTSSIMLLSEAIDEAAVEKSEESGMLLDVKINYKMRKNDEDARGFVESLLKKHSAV